MAKISIDSAKSRDLPDLEAIACGMGAHHEAGYFSRCLAEQGENRRLIGIARDISGAAVGYVQLNWQPKYPLFRKLGMPEIQDLNVLPPARRQGVGGALVFWCETQARQKGCGRMGISVGLSSAYGAAQRLYIQKGYVPDGAGIAHDDETVTPGSLKAVDDYLALKLVKDL